MAIITVDHVSKVYTPPKGAVFTALRDVSLAIQPGEFVALQGKSGSGKSTLLHLMGALDRPTTGTVSVDGVSLAEVSSKDLARLRAHRIGFLFQAFNLFPELSALDNVLLALWVADKGNTAEHQEQARQMLERVGLGNRLQAKAIQLSGGEQQRVALARALVKKPAIILADEPTGSLDSKNTESVMQLLASLHKEAGVTLVMVTHDDAVARYAQRIVYMRDGTLAAHL